MELPEATRIRLTTQYLIIEELVFKLTEEQCDKEVFVGNWTIRQQLAHLIRYQEVFFENIKTIMSTFNAVITPYAAEQDDGFLNIMKLPVSNMLIRLHEGRQIINDFYLNLNSGELIRKGRHTELGNFSIALWGEYFLLHEAQHIYQIFRMSVTLSENK
jgi:hypothetical protein